MFSKLQIDDIPRRSPEGSKPFVDHGNELFINESHDEEVHLEILSSYNQSAAEAEHNSDEMAIAIFNRSNLLMHLHMYKESLKDIEKSFGITNNEELKIIILNQKMKCMSLMDQADKDKLDHTQEHKAPTIRKVSETIPCAADCVTIKYNQKYGRHVVATKDIKPGTILVIEKGFVLVPRADKTSSNCSHCLMLAYNGVPCNSCAALIFCSEKCKEEAWLQYHDLECLILTFIRYNDSSCNLTPLITAVRLFLKFIKKEGLKNIVLATKNIKANNAEGKFLNGFFENEVFQSDKFQSFYNLSHSINKSYFSKKMVFYKSIIQKIINFLIEKTNVFKDYGEILNKKEESLFDFLTQVLNKLVSIVILNAFTFGENECQCEHPLLHILLSCDTKKIDEFIAPFSSLLNHSCDENTCKLFTNNQEILFIATKFIKKGEQIFTNYGVSLKDQKDVRQQVLQQNYNFTCKCQLCINDLADYLNVLKNPSDIANLIATFKKAGMNEKSLQIFGGDLCNAPFDETTIKDVIKMGRIIQKHFNTTFACAYSVHIKDYINLYYNKLYGAQLGIPNSC